MKVVWRAERMAESSATVVVVAPIVQLWLHDTRQGGGGGGGSSNNLSSRAGEHEGVAL